MPVPLDRGIAFGAGQLGHLDVDLLQLGDQGIQPAGGQHPVAGGDVEVAFARVLRQVAQWPATGQLTCIGRAFTRKNTQRGGLACAITADQTHPVAVLQADGGVGEQDPSPGPQFEAGCGDHVYLFYRSMRRIPRRSRSPVW